MTTFVLLTDRDDGTLLVACEDISEGHAVASAAVFSDGDTSAWLVPIHGITDTEWVKKQLRKNKSAGEIFDKAGNTGRITRVRNP